MTLAYLAGFEDGQSPWQRSLAFCAGIVGALVLLGSLSGLLGRIYGQVPALVPTLVALLAVLMGLNLLGLLRIPLPSGPDPDRWRNRVPAPIAPVAAGLAFVGLPCTTPVLAVLLGWIAPGPSPGGHGAAQLLGIGQVLPCWPACSPPACPNCWRCVRSVAGCRRSAEWCCSPVAC